VSTPSPANLRAFVRRHTRLATVRDVPGVRLHTAADVTVLWHLAGAELGLEDPPLPFWGFPWAGGLAVARYLLDHPAEVAGRRVLDIASGSGLCGIVAARLGAESVHAADVDPLAQAAATLNAHANDVKLAYSLDDPLARPLRDFDVDVILAGDVFYEETMAQRVMDWVQPAAAAGVAVLLGSPARRYVPSDLACIATYEVHTTRELERSEQVEASVFTLPGSGTEGAPKRRHGASS
jgi:predicted nicotinamide N-methyase